MELTLVSSCPKMASPSRPACCWQFVGTLLLSALLLLMLVEGSSASLLATDSLYFNDSNSRSLRRTNLPYRSPSISSSNISTTDSLSDLVPHHRQKRLLYFTGDRRLTFPAGTELFLTPTLSLPFIRNMPFGYDTGMTISVPFELSFDKLGWAHEDNPYGLYPDFGIFRKKRGLAAAAFGSTEYMYDIFTEILDKLGYPGKPCLLKAVCQMREGPLSESYGWLKDIIEWALTPSLNSRSSRGGEAIAEYLEAEKRGRGLDCSNYTQCSLTFFSAPPKKKSKSAVNHRKQDHGREHELNNEISDSESVKKTDEKEEAYHKELTIHKKNITVESLAHELQMKKRMEKIQAIAMLHAFKKVVR